MAKRDDADTLCVLTHTSGYLSTYTTYKTHSCSYTYTYIVILMSKVNCPIYITIYDPSGVTKS